MVVDNLLDERLKWAQDIVKKTGKFTAKTLLDGGYYEEFKKKFKSNLSLASLVSWYNHRNRSTAPKDPNHAPKKRGAYGSHRIWKFAESAKFVAITALNNVVGFEDENALKEFIKNNVSNPGLAIFKRVTAEVKVDVKIGN